MSPRRVVTTPVRLTGVVHPEQLESLIAVDAMLRRRAGLGEAAASWELTSIVGDVAHQRAVEREMARAGDRRIEVGREEFAERSHQLAEDGERSLRTIIAGLRVQADAERWFGDHEEATRAARVAFVRLYEAGVLFRSDAVLDGCPSCETVIDDADADQVSIAMTEVRIKVEAGDEVLEVDLVEPELLVGAVALAVPAASAPARRYVHLPLLDAEVPVVAIDGLERSRVVVPGHDAWSHDLVRQLGYPTIEVLDGQGVVRHPGPLEGLGRHAARAAAIERLMVDGHVIAHSTSERALKCCHRCHTALVPLLGRHWILSFRRLIDEVLGGLDAGDVQFSPPSARDDFALAAQQAESWCVSQQLWSGHPIPVFTCLDCGQTKVSVEDTDSCGSCMGTLQQHTDVLDARFIAAVTTLAQAGWPAQQQRDDHPTTLVVGPAGLRAWALPIAALGTRLTGSLPFDELIVHRGASAAAEPTSARTLATSVERHGPKASRAALLAGTLDFAAAEDVVALLDDPPEGDVDLEAWVEPFDHAVMALNAGAALAMLSAAVADGIEPSNRHRLAALSRPLLGD